MLYTMVVSYGDVNKDSGVAVTVLREHGHEGARSRGERSIIVYSHNTWNTGV